MKTYLQAEMHDLLATLLSDTALFMIGVLFLVSAAVVWFDIKKRK